MIAAKNDARKRKFDCRGASIRADIGGRGIRRWPTRRSLSLHGLAPPVALDIHFEDCGVMNETIDRGERAARQSRWESRDNQDEDAPLLG